MRADMISLKPGNSQSPDILAYRKEDDSIINKDPTDIHGE